MRSLARLPTGLREPSQTSVTLWEDSAPEKLTCYHCPTAGSRREVRHLTNKEWYFIFRLSSTLERSFGVSHLFYALKIKCQ